MIVAVQTCLWIYDFVSFLSLSMQILFSVIIIYIIDVSPDDGIFCTGRFFFSFWLKTYS